MDWVPLDEVCAAVRNPKQHDIAGIRASIGRFGFVSPAVRDERTGRLVAGHGRAEALRAMRAAGEAPPAGVRVDGDGGWLVPLLVGWASRSDAEAEAYLVADNQWTLAGGWDAPALADLLADVAATDEDLLAVAGFSADDLAALVTDDDASDDSDSEDGKGRLLGDLAGVTLGEPDITPEPGDVWWLGEHLVLVVASPHTEWHLWMSFLDNEGAVLLPYPSPAAPLAENPTGRRVVLVQPNPYLAGWLLTAWTRATGDTPRKTSV